MTLSYKMLDAGESALLCQGIERVYARTYPIPEFYDPAFLGEAIAGGKLHCVAAINSEGQVVASAEARNLLDYVLSDAR